MDSTANRFAALYVYEMPPACSDYRKKFLSSGIGTSICLVWAVDGLVPAANEAMRN